MSGDAPGAGGGGDDGGSVGGVALVVRPRGLRVVCVGGGDVARRKLLPFLHEGARVTLIAPDVVAPLAELEAEGALTWQRRTFAPADVEGAALVLAATASPEVNAGVVEVATAAGALSIRVDRDGAGTADVAATLRRGPLTVAITTGGEAPALAGALRRRLEAELDPEWGVLARLYGEARRDPEIRAVLAACGDDERRARWRRVPVTHILDLRRRGALPDAKAAIQTCLSSPSV